MLLWFLRMEPHLHEGPDLIQTCQLGWPATATGSHGSTPPSSCPRSTLLRAHYKSINNSRHEANTGTINSGRLGGNSKQHLNRYNRYTITKPPGSLACRQNTRVDQETGIYMRKSNKTKTPPTVPPTFPQGSSQPIFSGKRTGFVCLLHTCCLLMKMYATPLATGLCSDTSRVGSGKNDSWSAAASVPVTTTAPPPSPPSPRPTDSALVEDTDKVPPSRELDPVLLPPELLLASPPSDDVAGEDFEAVVAALLPDMASGRQSSTHNGRKCLT